MKGKKYFYKKQGSSCKVPLSALSLVLLLLLSLLSVEALSGGQSEPAAEPAGIVTPIPYRFVAGDRNIYKLTFENSASSDFRILLRDEKSSGAKQNEPPVGLAFSFKTTVRGDLTATVLDRKVDKVLIAYKLRNPVVTLIANEENSADQAEAIRNDLGKDIFALVSLQGKILSTWFDPSVGNVSQTYARALLALTQFVFPVEQLPEYDKWETQEEDPSGQYVASYRMIKSKEVPKASLKSFRKKKIRYLVYRQKSATGAIEIPTTIIPQGDLIARFDFGSGSLYSLNGSESQDVLVSKKKVGHAATTIKITFLRKDQLDAPELSLLRDAFSVREKIVTRVPLLVKPSREETEKAIQGRELGDATLESLLADLRKAESAKDPNFNSTSLYLKFKALIYLHPESCETLGKVLSSAGARSLTMSILPKALSINGHPQAQAALVEAIRAHSRDKSVLFQLLPSLATVDEPTPESEKTLMDLAFNSPVPEITSMAQLALGAQARRVARSSPERADKIVERFIQEIQSSSSPDQIRQLLLALGNAGSARALAEILRFATDPSPELRAIALHALRFIDSPEAEVTLVSALTSDKENSVRLAAAEALGFREMTKAMFKAQKEAFLKDPDANVRLRVLQNLWKVHEAFPEVRRLVKQAATNDSSKDVRKAAADIMARYGQAYFK